MTVTLTDFTGPRELLQARQTFCMFVPSLVFRMTIANWTSSQLFWCSYRFESCHNIGTPRLHPPPRPYTHLDLCLYSLFLGDQQSAFSKDFLSWKSSTNGMSPLWSLGPGCFWLALGFQMSSFSGPRSAVWWSFPSSLAHGHWRSSWPPGNNASVNISANVFV